MQDLVRTVPLRCQEEFLDLTAKEKGIKVRFFFFFSSLQCYLLGNQ